MTMPPEPEAPGRKTLTQELAELLRQAHKFDGRTVRVEVARGLRISMKISLEGELWLQLSRQGTFPSTTEWATVVQHFPGGAEQQGPILAGEEHGTYWMRARIRVTPQMF